MPHPRPAPLFQADLGEAFHALIKLSSHVASGMGQVGFQEQLRLPEGIELCGRVVYFCGRFRNAPHTWQQAARLFTLMNLQIFSPDVRSHRGMQRQRFHSSDNERDGGGNCWRRKLTCASVSNSSLRRWWCGRVGPGGQAAMIARSRHLS